MKIAIEIAQEMALDKLKPRDDIYKRRDECLPPTSKRSAPSSHTKTKKAKTAAPQNADKEMSEKDQRKEDQIEKEEEVENSPRCCFCFKLVSDFYEDSMTKTSFCRTCAADVYESA